MWVAKLVQENRAVVPTEKLINYRCLYLPMVTTIQIEEDLKERLDELKIHHRESYNALIERILENCSLNSVDDESLIATIEVLSDPNLMRGIKEALEEENRREKGTTLKDLKKELGF